MIAAIGWKTYLVFAIFNLGFIPVIYFFYPETAGRSLEEIDIVFARAYVDKVSPVKVAKTMKKLDVREVEMAELELRDEGTQAVAVNVNMDVGAGPPDEEKAVAADKVE